MDTLLTYAWAAGFLDHEWRTNMCKKLKEAKVLEAA